MPFESKAAALEYDFDGTPMMSGRRCIPISAGRWLSGGGLTEAPMFVADRLRIRAAQLKRGRQAVCGQARGATRGRVRGGADEARTRARQHSLRSSPKLLHAPQSRRERDLL